jgi:hypothetical protein
MAISEEIITVEALAVLVCPYGDRRLTVTSLVTDTADTAGPEPTVADATDNGGRVNVRPVPPACIAHKLGRPAPRR